MNVIVTIKDNTSPNTKPIEILIVDADKSADTTHKMKVADFTVKDLTNDIAAIMDIFQAQ